MSRYLSYDNEMDQELALMALAASPTPEDACAYLKTEHNLIAVPAKLTTMARFRSEQYAELRQRIAPLKEKMLVHNMSDNALYASEVVKVSMEQLMERLTNGDIAPQFLSRVARDVADVQAKSIDKKLALEGRPTVITENRTPQQIIQALERIGVMRPAPTIQIGAGDVQDRTTDG